MHRKYSLLFLVLFCSLHTAFAQVGQSPYTVIGLGSLNSLATARNVGMGGVGIANSHYLYLNNMNPALLVRNSYYTSFEAGLSLESRELTTLEEQDRTSSGGLDYVAIAFPILYEKITFSAGLAPYSTVNYNMITERPIEGSEALSLIAFTGSGGTSQAYAATGFKIYKGLSAGLRASYIFGAINEEITSSIINRNPGVPAYVARYYSLTSFSDVLFAGGLAYRQPISGKENHFLTAGFTYDLEADLSATRSGRIERAGSVDMPAPADSLLETTEGRYFLPASIGTGLAYEKLYHYSIGADFKWQNWEDYRGFEGNPEENLGKSYRVAVGGEWTPDYASAKAGTYYKRMTYRMGLQYEKTPFVVNRENINDFGINFGISLPVSNASSIHTTFLFGQRGTTDNDLVRERYFRLGLGITFNDRWFTKVKYD